MLDQSENEIKDTRTIKIDGNKPSESTTILQDSIITTDDENSTNIKIYSDDSTLWNFGEQVDVINREFQRQKFFNFKESSNDQSEMSKIGKNVWMS